MPTATAGWRIPSIPRCPSRAYWTSSTRRAGVAHSTRRRPRHPNSFGPRKRPFHTLLACIVTRDSAPVAGYATMGGDGQAMFHVQALTNLLDYKMEIQEAIERPRFVTGPIDPGDAADQVRIESRVPEPVREGLAARGHRVVAVSDWFLRMGHAQGITIKDGTLRGGADPRGDGAAMGF